MVASRRFNGQRFRLYNRIGHYDSMGRKRSPNATRYAAEKQADALRDRGLNARVVNWVGGSGVFVAPSKRYHRKISESLRRAREEWLKQLELEEYESLVFGAQTYDISGSAGTPIEFAKDAELATLIKGNDDWDKFNAESIQNGVNVLKFSTLDDAIIDSINEDNVPIASNEPIGAVRTYTHMAITPDMIDEATKNGGEIGWGAIEFESDFVVGPKQRMPMPGREDTRRRYRVAMNFLINEEEYGENPTYAFATKEAAEKFARKLREKIDQQGYYFSTGGDIGFGARLNRADVMVPAESIEIDVVEEESIITNQRERVLTRRDVVPFLQAMDLNPDETNQRLFEELGEPETIGKSLFDDDVRVSR